MHYVTVLRLLCEYTEPLICCRVMTCNANSGITIYYAQDHAFGSKETHTDYMWHCGGLLKDPLLLGLCGNIVPVQSYWRDGPCLVGC